MLTDRNHTFWTLTEWDGEPNMRAFMTSGAHRNVMPGLLNWCDEASIVDWEQADAGLPSWDEATRRMRNEGRPSKVKHPSPHHASMTFAEPRIRPGTPIRPYSAR